MVRKLLNIGQSALILISITALIHPAQAQQQADNPSLISCEPKITTESLFWPEKAEELIGHYSLEGPKGHPITAISQIDESNASNITDIIGQVRDGGLVIVTTPIKLGRDKSIKIGYNYITVVGGGSNLILWNLQDGKPYQVKLPGSRPLITQTDSSVDIFWITLHSHITLKGMDLVGGKNGVFSAYGSDLTLVDLKVQGVAEDGFRLATPSSCVQKIESSRSGGVGLNLILAHNSRLIDSQITKAGTEGVMIYQSNNVQLLKVTSDSAKENGFRLEKGENIHLVQVKSTHALASGIIFSEFNQADLVDVQVDMKKRAGSIAIAVSESGQVGVPIAFHQVTVMNAEYAYGFGPGSTIKDLGGNKAIQVVHTCDEVADATGFILVNGRKCQ